MPDAQQTIADMIRNWRRLHLRRLGRVNPPWGIRRNRKAVYFMAFRRGVAIRWCKK